MEILIKNISEILSDKLSICQRGLMITLLLIKENNPKLTEAKFKALVSIKQHRSDLVNLHENNFIKWKGYRSAKKQLQATIDTSKEESIIIFMNNIYGRNFSVKSRHNIRLVTSLLKKYKQDDIKLVISNRYLEWKDEPVMSKHLNPTTVFRPINFEKYLEEATHTRVGEGIIAIEQIDLQIGDIIGEQHLDNLVPRHGYKIKIYQEDIYLNTRIIYGKDLRQLIRKSKRAGQENIIYKYAG
jgi:uncharacterized phage protein (TIGR02220 family)